MSSLDKITNYISIFLAVVLVTLSGLILWRNSNPNDKTASNSPIEEVNNEISSTNTSPPTPTVNKNTSKTKLPTKAVTSTKQSLKSAKLNGQFTLALDSAIKFDGNNELKLLAIDASESSTGQSVALVQVSLGGESIILVYVAESSSVDIQSGQAETLGYNIAVRKIENTTVTFVVKKL